MISLGNNQKAFFSILRAGLWEHSALLLPYEKVDYQEVMRIAEEQSVVGLITAGLEHVMDLKVPKVELLQFIGQALQIEDENKAMNEYVSWLIDQLRKEDIYALLVKGQGIAQCYEKPLWRASGDVDLLLRDSNYEKAKEVLMPVALCVDNEFKSFKHIGMTMQGGILVELHGTLHTRLSNRVDRVIDKAQDDIFYGGNVRSWLNGHTTVFLPSPDNDVIFVFTHILHHYYIEGIGLRQICDWCRLLWTYRDSLDCRLLETRISEMGLMSEWKAFAAVAVEWLGMPAEAMPLYSPKKKWKKKSERIIAFVLECGNFGHNRPASAGKMNSAWQKIKDFMNHAKVFPWDSVLFFWHFMLNGIGLVLEKKTNR